MKTVADQFVKTSQRSAFTAFTESLTIDFMRSPSLCGGKATSNGFTSAMRQSHLLRPVRTNALAVCAGRYDSGNLSLINGPWDFHDLGVPVLGIAVHISSARDRVNGNAPCRRRHPYVSQAKAADTAVGEVARRGHGPSGLRHGACGWKDQPEAAGTAKHLLCNVRKWVDLHQI
jgi:hypothetical protein